MDLLTERVALGVVAVAMALCCLRLPAPADGSPDVKAFARDAAQFLRSGTAVYVIKSVCPNDKPSPTAGELFVADTNIRTSLVFYLNRPLTCIAARHVLDGANLHGAYVITDGESWPPLSHLGHVVVQTIQDGHGYILARMK